MGFTTGFLGGLTLTYSLVYLSVYVHRSNRTHQSLLLRQQARLLNSKVDPPELEYEPPAYRVEKAGLDEELKDRWNREVETLVRKAQSTDWEAVRLRWENRIGNVWDKVRNSDKAQELEHTLQDKAQEIEQQVQDKVQEIQQRAQDTVQDIQQRAQGKVQEIEQRVQGKVQELEQNFQEKLVSTERMTEAAKEDTAQAVHGKRLLEEKFTDGAKNNATQAVYGKRLLEEK